MARAFKRWMSFVWVGLSAFGALAGAPGPVEGQPRSQARAGVLPDDEETKIKAKAKAFAEAGAARFDKGEYREALLEFRRSLELRKNRAVMLNIARSLELLGQYDEALLQCEEIEREFKDAPADFQSKVAETAKALRALLGNLALSGDVPDGASLFIDNRLIGKLPSAAPLRLSKGVRQIRVEKEGFEPIVASVEVRAGQDVTATLTARSKKGRLRVIEKHGWSLGVEIDGKDTGAKTPWEGEVDAGEHRVKLRGRMSAEALLSCAVGADEVGQGSGSPETDAKMESAEETAHVGLYEVKVVAVGADATDASLKVESMPKGAIVWIDGADAGKTPWEGRLPLGTHAIHVEAEGYLPTKQQVTLERRKQKEVTLVLDRVPEEPRLLSVDAQKKLGWSVGGVGVLGLAVGAVAGGLAIDQAGQIRQRCGGDTCPGNEQANVERVNDLSAASTAGFVVGGIGAAVGALLLLTLPPAGPDVRTGPKGGSTARANRLVWTIAAGAGRMEVGGRF